MDDLIQVWEQRARELDRLAAIGRNSADAAVQAAAWWQAASELRERFAARKPSDKPAVAGRTHSPSCPSVTSPGCGCDCLMLGDADPAAVVVVHEPPRHRTDLTLRGAVVATVNAPASLVQEVVNGIRERLLQPERGDSRHADYHRECRPGTARPATPEEQFAYENLPAQAFSEAGI